MERPTTIRFADFEANLATSELRKHGFRLRLQEKPFQALAALLEKPGELVTREELRNRLWGADTFVDFDNNLNTAVYKLREALADTGEIPRYIETLPKKGYRFIGKIEGDAPTSAAQPSSVLRSPWRASVAASLLLVVVAIASYVALTGRTSAASAASSSPSAREAFLKGRYLMEKGNPQDTVQAIQFFEEAISHDSGFAEAHSALSNALRHSGGMPSTWINRARAEAQQAIALKPGLAGAHLNLALLSLYDDWDWDAARAAFERAASLAPDSPEVHHSYAGFYSLLGDHERALAEMHRAMELDPVAVAISADAGWYWHVARRYDEAIAQSRKALELEPNHRGAHYYILISLVAKNDLAEARKWALKYLAILGSEKSELARVAADDPGAGLREFWRIRLQKALAREPQQPLVAGEIALAYTALGENENALTWLERLYQLHSGWLLPFMRVYPPLDGLRANPRFIALQEKMNFPRK